MITDVKIDSFEDYLLVIEINKLVLGLGISPMIKFSVFIDLLLQE